MSRTPEEHLEMAEDVDGMDRDVTSFEADFLDNVLPLLRKGWRLSPKRAKVLERMHAKYFGGGMTQEVDEGEE